MHQWTHRARYDSGMRNSQHMHAITVRISDFQLRLAILCALLESLRTVSMLVIGIALIAGVFVLHLQGMVGASLFSSVTAGILIGLIGWIALNAVLFVVNVKAAHCITPSPQSTPLAYLFTNEGCKISKGDISRSIPREDFRRLLRRPSMSLLKVVGTHPPTRARYVVACCIASTLRAVTVSPFGRH